MFLDAYVGNSGPNNKFGNYFKMEGKGGNDTLGSDASVPTKIFGNGGSDFLYYSGTAESKIDGGRGDDQLLGGGKNDKLIGGKGDDWLFGRFGNDLLKGKKGNDHFSFTTTPNSETNKDDIADFNPGKDFLHFNTGVYRAFNYYGELNKKNFEKGKKADDEDDFLGYHAKKGVIWYDFNGDEPGGKEKVACVDEGLKLSYHNFILDA
ncbi:MAG: calcium-binding protein [Hyphomicrobiales bacterium]|nr:calcium-binding protein [Hyphomicrobiales bacterium]